MRRLRPLLTCTLALCVLFAGPVHAQQSFVTMRTSLRTDLTPEAIAAEAFEASKRIGAKDEERALALRKVAEALEFVGRLDEARSMLSRAIEAAKADESPYVVAPTVPVYARLHGADKAVKYLSTISDRRQRVQGGIQWLEDALERGSDADLKTAAAALHSHYHSEWDPDADANLSVAYRRLGNMAWAKTTGDRVLLGQLVLTSDIRYGWAIRVMVDEALEAGDFDRAESYLEHLAKLDESEWGVDFERRMLSERFIERGEIDRAVKQLGLMKDLTQRCDAQMSIALEWLRRGEMEKAELNFEEALKGAERDGTIAITRVIRKLYWAGVPDKERIVRMLFTELLEKVKKKREPRKTMETGFLASAACGVAREDLFDLVLPLVESGSLRTAGVELVQAHTRNEDLAGLCRVWDEWLVREDLKEMKYTLASAIDVAVYQAKGRGYQPPSRNDRFRAELLEASIDRARTVKEPAERAFTLALLVTSKLATPLEESATHPWHVPPILADGWTTPEDAEPYAASLKSALGERAMPVVRAIRTRALAFDPGAELVEIDGVLGALPYQFILVRKADQTFLFDGSREPVDALAATAQWRQSDEALLELVHFSISSRATKDGRFRLVQTLEEVEGLREPGEAMPVLELKPAEVVERTEDGAKVETNLLVAGQLERVSAAVDSAGRVSMGGLGVVATGLPLGREFAVGGGFQRRRLQIEDALALRQEDPAAGAYAIAHAYATGFGEGGWLRDTNIAWSWLLAAQSAGHPHPFRQIGLDWRDGNGVQTNRTEAEEWLVGSAMNGDFEAGLAAAELLLQSPSPERRARARTVLRLGQKAEHEASIEKLRELEGGN